MRDVFIIGVNTLRFGKYLDKSIKDLAQETVLACLKEASIDTKTIQALWFANSGWGYVKGQESIRGQVALRPIGIESIPITNIENACAGGSTAFHHAWHGVASGLYDITMAVGAEKVYQSNKYSVFAGFLGGLDIENIADIVANISIYGMTAEDKKHLQEHIQKYAHLSTNGNKLKNKKKSLTQKLQDIKDMFKVYMRPLLSGC
jgi:acetyl-CoA acyltransferase